MNQPIAVPQPGHKLPTTRFGWAVACVDRHRPFFWPRVAWRWLCFTFVWLFFELPERCTLAHDRFECWVESLNADRVIEALDIAAAIIGFVVGLILALIVMWGVYALFQGV